VEHRFTGPAYTIGIEEELMIVDAETLELSNSIESLLEALGETNQVKPELMEAVCEIATDPCRNTREAGLQLRELRKRVQMTAESLGLAIGSAGTHPFAMWEDQRIVARPRYRDLIAGLQFVARQELIFGVHVHVGVDDPDKAVYVANGMRVHVPLLLALSANSPFWRGDETRLLSTRTPIFRAFPRVGIPPRYDDRGLHLPLVRRQAAPEFRHGRGSRDGCADARRAHPRPGGAGPGDGEGAEREVRPGLRARAIPVRDAGREQVDLPETARVPTNDLVRRIVDRLKPHAEELGSDDDLDCIDDLLEKGNGASRQVVVFEANHDLREVMREIVEKTSQPD
jgi:carboxylate-amine ligase